MIAERSTTIAAPNGIATMAESPTVIGTRRGISVWRQERDNTMRFGKRFFVLALATFTSVVLCLPAIRLADTAVAGHPRAARPFPRSVRGDHGYGHPGGYGHGGYGLAPYGYPGGYITLYPYGPMARGYLAPFPPGPYSYHGYSAYAFQLYGHPPGVAPPHDLRRLVEPMTPENPSHVEPEPETIPPPLPDQ